MNESRSKKTPVTHIFHDHHHEKSTGWRSRNRFSGAFFGLMDAFNIGICNADVEESVRPETGSTACAVHAADPAIEIARRRHQKPTVTTDLPWFSNHFVPLSRP